MKSLGFKNGFWIAVVITVLGGLWGCGGKTTPPGASFITGSLSNPQEFGGSFTILQWQNGLTVVLFDDLEGEHKSSGSGSTEDPTWRGKGVARAVDGREVNWRVETTAGNTSAIFIDEQSYDLRQGTLFLIRTRGGETQIIQQPLNLVGRCTDYDACQHWLKQDARVLQFSQEIANPQ